MSVTIESRFRHRIVVKTTGPILDHDGNPVLDEYSQPTAGESTLATVRGLIEPRTAREQTSAAQTGAVIGDYVGFIKPLAGLTTACWLERKGVRYDILAMPDAAGLEHHLELALKAVT